MKVHKTHHKSRNNIFLFLKGAKTTCSVKRVGGGEDDLFSARQVIPVSIALLSHGHYFLKELFEVNIYTGNYLTECCETCKRRQRRWMQAQKHQNKQQQHFCVEWKGDRNYRNNLCTSLKRAWLIFVQLVSKNIKMYTKLELFSQD